MLGYLSGRFDLMLLRSLACPSSGLACGVFILDNRRRRPGAARFQRLWSDDDDASGPEHGLDGMLEVPGRVEAVALSGRDFHSLADTGELQPQPMLPGVVPSPQRISPTAVDG